MNFDEGKKQKCKDEGFSWGMEGHKNRLVLEEGRGKGCLQQYLALDFCRISEVFWTQNSSVGNWTEA